MSYLQELNTLPLYGDIRERERLFVEQRRMLEQRAELVKRYMNIEGHPAPVNLDPVLRFHLGLGR